MASDSARGLAAFGAFGVFSAAYVYAMARAERARDDRERVLVLVSGDGFTSASLDAPSAPATFVGCALVRGVKMYIDPKLKGCREYVDPKDGSQRVNPALVCSGASVDRGSIPDRIAVRIPRRFAGSPPPPPPRRPRRPRRSSPTSPRFVSSPLPSISPGDDLDANVYECYAVEPSAVLRALRGEPRMLGLTTDTVLVDLDASETSAKLSRLLKRRAQDEHLANGGTLATVDYDRAALLTFVAHRIPRGAVPAEPAYAKDDGTRVFEWTACVGAFAEGVDAVGEDGDGAAREKHARALERATRSAQRNGKWLNESDPYGAGPGTLRCRGVTTRDAEALAAPETEARPDIDAPFPARPRTRGWVHADPLGLFFPSLVSAHHPSLTIPTYLDAFRLRH